MQYDLENYMFTFNNLLNNIENYSHNKNISNKLDKFDPISLEQMDNVKLLKRKDTKFIFTEGNLLNFLEDMSEYYYILDINNNRISRYETLYFDTDERKLYLAHHNGKKNRFKVRFRRYIDTDQCFLEVKLKSNKNITNKKRKPKDKIETQLSNESKIEIEEYTPINSEFLKPQFWIYYDRITLVHKYLKERVTIDLNLRFKNNKSDYNLSPLVILELKQEKFSKESHILKCLKNEKINRISFSKYCIGSILLEENIKYNQFKYIILNIRKQFYGRY